MGALDGVLVADFSRVLAGPVATMMLGDLGADVVKVERPGTGDDTRAWGPPFRDGESTYNLSVNRNKRSVELDLTDPGDLELARELARRADVLVENFHVGGAERLGLGYDDLRAENPGLVYCSISGFGRGEGAELSGYDFILQAVGGLMSITGDEEPRKVGVALVDVVAGLYATIGILAALNIGPRGPARGREPALERAGGDGEPVGGVRRRRRGAGTDGKRAPEHRAVRDACAPPTASWPSRPATTGSSPRCAACSGSSALAEDPRFASNPSRVSNREELVKELEAALGSRAVDEWVGLLSEAGVACGPVNDMAAAFALAESLGLDPVAPGRVPTVADPIGLSRDPVAYDRPAPAPGRAFRRDQGLAGVSITLGGCMQAPSLARSPATCRNPG